MPASLDHRQRMLRHLEGQQKRPRRCDIAKFLQAAIIAAAQAAPDYLLVTLASTAISESDIVRVDLSDGSILMIDVEHLVPRDYFDSEPA